MTRGAICQALKLSLPLEKTMTTDLTTKSSELQYLLKEKVINKQLIWRDVSVYWILRKQFGPARISASYQDVIRLGYTSPHYKQPMTPEQVGMSIVRLVGCGLLRRIGKAGTDYELA